MNPPVLTEDQIRELIGPTEALEVVRSAFYELAQGRATLPAVMGFEIGTECGEVHVKAAHLHGTPFYSIKIASGFYGNAARGLPTGNGTIVVFDGRTGQLRALLLDNGFLTELRTGAAGALAADILSNKDAETVGIIGCGSQARYQLDALRRVRRVRNVFVYGRSTERAEQFAREVGKRLELEISVARSAKEVFDQAEIIVTVTPSRAPIVESDWLRRGQHITAVGSDSPGKQELDPSVLARVDKIVVDRREQCLQFGEMQHASAVGIHADSIYAEIGELVAGLRRGRASVQEITLADLTGVGVQDSAVANHVVERALCLGLLK
jgi:ornithine cyclodeaminase